MDNVNHPKHYTAHPSGVECIEITEHMGFNLGNVIKYTWRCDLKQDAIEDLKKAGFYLDREIALRVERARLRAAEKSRLRASINMASSGAQEKDEYCEEKRPPSHKGATTTTKASYSETIG